MADNSESFKKIQNLLTDQKYQASDMAKRMGTKEDVVTKGIQALELLDKNRPSMDDKDAYNAWSAMRNQWLDRLKAVKEYAPTLPETARASNFDELNQRGYLKVGAKDPAAKILEKEASMLDPHDFKQQQGFQKTSAPNMDGLQKPNIMDAKAKGLAKLAGKEAGSMSKVLKGGGKIAALSAALGAMGSAMAGEPVDVKETLKAGAEGLNPLPFSIEEMGAEMKNLEGATATPEKIQQDIQRIEQDKIAREEAARPGALEFGSRFKELQDRMRNSKK